MTRADIYNSLMASIWRNAHGEYRRGMTWEVWEKYVAWRYEWFDQIERHFQCTTKHTIQQVIYRRPMNSKIR